MPYHKPTPPQTQVVDMEAFVAECLRLLRPPTGEDAEFYVAHQLCVKFNCTNKLGQPPLWAVVLVEAIKNNYEYFNPPIGLT